MDSQQIARQIQSGVMAAAGRAAYRAQVAAAVYVELLCQRQRSESEDTSTREMASLAPLAVQAADDLLAALGL